MRIERYRSACLSAIAALSCSLLSAGALQAAAPLKLASLFTDHAVLQRDMPVPVWGDAEPGRNVTVQFAGQEKTAAVDKDGHWLIKLDPLTASAEGRTLTAKTPDDAPLTKSDILVGEVWICSGQSNMGFGLAGAETGPAALAAAGDNELRLFDARAHAEDAPQRYIDGGWLPDSRRAANGFSAVAYFFGKELRKALNVPVGLVKSAVGGTVAEAWTPQVDLEANPVLKPLVDRQTQGVAAYPKQLQDYKDREPRLIAAFEQALEKAKAAGETNLPKKPAPPADPGKNNNRPAGLYNGSIYPFVPYAMRGVIWYQGEANSGRGKEYQTLFPALIGGWRKVWGQGDFPFLFVQITPHQGMRPELRDAQRITTQTTQNTAMAVTTDVGHPTDIHPRHKEPVGQRLALAAQALAYGKDIAYSGPAYDWLSVDGNRATLHFKHLGGGLVAKDGELRGFEIAGAEGNFGPATAKIDGDTIVVSSESVSAPKAVRFGWATVPDVNLYNKAGLPASPFQTDGAFTVEAGFEPLFNGKDLTGWHYQGGEPLDGKLNATDGRYTARDGRIVVNPGKGLAQLWTTREFPRDFELRLDFRAGVNADSGIFLRKPQLQCRDYLVAGPYKELKSYKPQDWNEIVVTVKGSVATATCNGEPLKFDNPLPATGPIGLEADRGQMEYRRIRIKETP